MSGEGQRVFQESVERGHNQNPDKVCWETVPGKGQDASAPCRSAVMDSEATIALQHGVVIRISCESPVNEERLIREDLVASSARLLLGRRIVLCHRTRRARLWGCRRDRGCNKLPLLKLNWTAALRSFACQESATVFSRPSASQPTERQYFSAIQIVRLVAIPAGGLVNFIVAWQLAA